MCIRDRSLALASHERGVPTGSRSPQRVAASTPRSRRPAWPGAEEISSVSTGVPVCGPWVEVL
eukprot:14760507-Alexandrium_andersonii.AAC.1